MVHALDARTGDFIWEYRREMDEGRRSAAQMRSLAVYQDLVILNTVDAHVVGLDARTGEARWDTPVGGGHDGYTFSNGPIVVDGTVVAGLTGCGRYRDDTCYVVGVDGRTGRLLWRTSTRRERRRHVGRPAPHVPRGRRRLDDRELRPRHRARLLGHVAAQAAQPRRPRHRRRRPLQQLNPRARPATGGLRWYYQHYQHIPGDSHDMDESFERILIDYDGRRSLFTMGKLGILWELDRRHG